jgi:hypothetical protein
VASVVQIRCMAASPPALPGIRPNRPNRAARRAAAGRGGGEQPVDQLAHHPAVAADSRPANRMSQARTNSLPAPRTRLSICTTATRRLALRPEQERDRRLADQLRRLQPVLLWPKLPCRASGSEPSMSREYLITSSGSPQFRAEGDVLASLDQLLVEVLEPIERDVPQLVVGLAGFAIASSKSLPTKTWRILHTEYRRPLATFAAYFDRGCAPLLHDV